MSITYSDGLDVEETVTQLAKLCPGATPDQLAERLRRRARVLRPLEPRLALQLDARATEMQQQARRGEYKREWDARRGLP